MSSVICGLVRLEIHLLRRRLFRGASLCFRVYANDSEFLKSEALAMRRQVNYSVFILLRGPSAVLLGELPSDFALFRVVIVWRIPQLHLESLPATI